MHLAGFIIKKFVVDLFGLDSILLTEGNILYF